VSGRDIALCVIAVLTVAAVAGTGGAIAAERRRPASPGLAVLILGAAFACGAWAIVGWAWYLSGGTVS